MAFHLAIFLTRYDFPEDVGEEILPAAAAMRLHALPFGLVNDFYVDSQVLAYSWHHFQSYLSQQETTRIRVHRRNSNQHVTHGIGISFADISFRHISLQLVKSECENSPDAPVFALTNAVLSKRDKILQSVPKRKAEK